MFFNCLPFAIGLLFATYTLASGVTIAYDKRYDSAKTSVSKSACGKRLETFLGAHTYGSIPTFPQIGAADFITHIDHPSCATCGMLVHVDEEGTTHLINFLIMDRSTTAPFVLGKKAMDRLTGGQAEKLGRVNATFRQMPNSFCDKPIAMSMPLDECQ
ncbi:hypothetical protein ONZ45_g17101 [Pleurotus djamor]|nr:hypothetical protein ONZ45_g17101 [Pleurotus djamor]